MVRAPLGYGAGWLGPSWRCEATATARGGWWHQSCPTEQQQRVAAWIRPPPLPPWLHWRVASRIRWDGATTARIGGEVASSGGSSGLEPAGGGSVDLAVRSPPTVGSTARNAATVGSTAAAPPRSSVGRPDPGCPTRMLAPVSSGRSGGPWMGSAGLSMGFPFLFFIRFTETDIQPPRKIPHLS